mmetsp:Transcript_8727/g.32500  ORF Transcript_8727/g.32500 Transcript_8727/m.32500 type:complete len:207 (-) Transcript_8727:627-1247(-)
MATLGVSSNVISVIFQNLARKRVRVAQLNLMSRLLHKRSVVRRVLARQTRAILAIHPGGEAFTVQLQALTLLTIALLSFGHHRSARRIKPPSVHRRASAHRRRRRRRILTRARRASRRRRLGHWSLHRRRGTLVGHASNRSSANARRIHVEIFQRLREPLGPFHRRPRRARSLARSFVAPRRSATGGVFAAFNANHGIIKLVVHIL